MFAVFLPALDFRGNRSAYLWWFYKFLTEFGEQAGYICGDEYFADPERHLANGRAEAGEDLARRCQYRVPDVQALSRVARADIPLRVWRSLEDLFPSNPLEAFKYFCSKEDKPLLMALTSAFDQIGSNGETIEAVITCVNCASLQSLCRERKLPLIHIELGPLRSPLYLQTAYFDFSGVNGGTESWQRFNAAGAGPVDEWQALEALRSLFFMKRLPNEGRPTIDLGIGLQVEDDSNIICYSNGFSSLSLLNAARSMLAEQLVSAPVLVRPHPGSIFSLQNLPAGLVYDNSETSVDFILQCKRIRTINSSLAVESLLLGREVDMYGESPFVSCVDRDTHEVNQPFLSFFLLNYLVPWKLAFSTEYIRWRLGMPAEEAIRNVHVEFFMHEKIKLLESRIAELEQALEGRDREIDRLKSTISWHLSYPLRAASKIVRKILDSRR